MNNIGNFVIRVEKSNVIELIEHQYGFCLKWYETDVMKEGLYNLSILSAIIEARKNDISIDEFMESTFGEYGTFTDIIEPNATPSANLGERSNPSLVGVLSGIVPFDNPPAENVFHRTPAQLHPPHVLGSPIDNV